ncbi:hypothetical protein Misp01_01240 [Microtetraspora sp. NBRC 13810]|uniref:hypothetical protein n=1 Tax=Microtetraspora sp. NBRC 13810 TaxID=3030990 RepID=UPI0024A2C615|nr:hypothetical protein [Microtetraspora sp. NBRC 13810]GLW04994.1 hypothetical protein Misp01_01240 [Microtetraspora sp. NBRC 13810]
MGHDTDAAPAVHAVRVTPVTAAAVTPTSADGAAVAVRLARPARSTGLGVLVPPGGRGPGALTVAGDRPGFVTARAGALGLMLAEDAWRRVICLPDRRATATA